MSNYIASDTDLTAVADAIRTKGNTQAPLEFPSGFESAIGTLGDATLAALIGRTITEIEIPSGVVTVGDYAFFNCGYLTSVLIPTSVRFIGIAAFSSCMRLASIDIPNNVIQIKTNAFSNCFALTSIELPSGMVSIQDYAFMSCQNLTSITCNAVNPPTLGTGVFSGVPADCAIYVPAASVSAYQAASGWSGRAAYIQPIPT